jgi:hypothetical protein
VRQFKMIDATLASLFVPTSSALAAATAAEEATASSTLR